MIDYEIFSSGQNYINVIFPNSRKGKIEKHPLSTNEMNYGSSPFCVGKLSLSILNYMSFPPPDISGGKLVPRENGGEGIQFRRNKRLWMPVSTGMTNNADVML